ncbi:MAG: hypothetical protein EB035_03505, partial [Actinobacteria bacterium]|nr:hypothetical protein [Actinomycetota bacterium]
GENGTPAYCYYKNDPTTVSKYGLLYNWYAVNDPRGLAPEGFQIPEIEDWDELVYHLGDDAGKKTKSDEPIMRLARHSPNRIHGAENERWYRHERIMIFNVELIPKRTQDIQPYYEN